MSLVPLLTGEQFADADRDAVSGGTQAYGKILNTWAAIGHSPGMFATYLPFLRTVNGPGELEGRIKELTAVRVGVLNHCLYTTSHRCTAALANGATERDLAAVASGDFDGFTDRERVAFQLADQLTTGIPTTTRDQEQAGISAQLRAAVEKTFTPRELVELTMSISLWNALSRFHRVMGFELDMPEPPAEVSALL